MGETTNQIEKHIEHTRQDLGHNLNELERRVKSATDWKRQFQAKPMTMLGVAFGGGLMMASMLGGARKSRSTVRSSHGLPPAERYEPQRFKAQDTFDTIKGALMGVAATRLKDYVEEFIPGFREHFSRLEEKRIASTR